MNNRVEQESGNNKNPSYLDVKDITPLQFHLAEIQYLRDEIKYRSQDQSNIERNIFIAIFAVYATLSTLDATKVDPDLRTYSPYFWWIPFVIAIYGRSRYFDNHNAIGRIAGYIRSCETLLDPVRGGWQN